MAPAAIARSYIAGTCGKTSGLGVEVLAGLQEGERFVAQPGVLDLGGKRIVAQ